MILEVSLGISNFLLSAEAVFVQHSFHTGKDAMKLYN